MITRRDLLAQTVSTGLMATRPGRLVRASAGLTIPRIKSVVRREETTLRLGGNGDTWYMTWAADDRQLVALCDGAGWSKNPQLLYNSRLFAIRGEPHAATFQEVPGYPELTNFTSPADTGRYYGLGTLAMDGCIYQFLSTFNHRTFRSDLSADLGDLRFVGVKLIYSRDNGRTWCNQDGSTPVVWEPWQRRSRRNMVFFEEPQQAFSALTVLQMGRNYEANRDGYVYIFAPNGNTDGTMNELVMFRVAKAHILERNAYEFFSGLRPDGGASWERDIDARGIVHTFPRGWVNTKGQIYAWFPSVAYNAPLGLYMMANLGQGCAPDGTGFAKPSYLGFWTARNPWGPWTQIHEETAWTPGSDPAARCYSPQIAPKWIASDGKSFWLVWSDDQNTGQKQELLKKMQEFARNGTYSSAEVTRFVSEQRRIMPHYTFNTQRVDLLSP